jgi:hypothetical protein
MPDSIPSLVAVLQRQVANLEEDLRAFGPLLGKQIELQVTLDHMQADLRAFREDLHELKTSHEKEVRERKQNRALINVAAIGLIGTFLSSMATVLVAVL